MVGVGVWGGPELLQGRGGIQQCTAEWGPQKESGRSVKLGEELGTPQFFFQWLQSVPQCLLAGTRGHSTSPGALCGRVCRWITTKTSAGGAFTGAGAGDLCASAPLYIRFPLKGVQLQISTSICCFCCRFWLDCTTAQGREGKESKGIVLKNGYRSRDVGQQQCGEGEL